MKARHVLAVLSLVIWATISSPGIVSANSADPASPSICCVGMRGNVNGKGIVDLVDLTSLVSYLTGSGYIPPCMDAANVNGLGIVDLVDLTTLVQYLQGFPVSLLPCPGDTSFLADNIRIASLHAVDTKFSSLARLPVDSFNQAMLTYLQGRPEFADAGISPSAGNVWARYTDGILLLVTNSFGQSLDTLPGDLLPPDTGASPVLVPREERPGQVRSMQNLSASGTGDDLPKSVGYRLVSTVGTAYPAIATTRSRLKSWLKSSNYLESSPLSSVYEMRKVGGDGLFCYFGHGGAGKLISIVDGEFDYGIWTSSSAEVVDSIRLFAEDFVAKRLCYCVGPNSYDPINNVVVPAARIGITSKFITYYWKPFAPNALVIINACGSDSVPAFRNAIMAKGGPAYFGWSVSVSSKGACASTEYLVDRLLGVNKAYPREDPKQRPFPVGDVYGDMSSRGFNVQPGGDGTNSTTSTFRYHPGASNFGLLAPTISFVSVDETLELLTLNGIFGADPGADGRVMVNGTPLTVVSWSVNEIFCELPRSGGGSEGPVTVESRGDFGGETPLTYRESNVVNITSWQIPFHYEHHEGGAGILVDMNLHIRGDIHAHREVIHEPPVNLVGVPFNHDKDSHGSFSASGVVTNCDGECGPGIPNCMTNTWSGGGEMPVYENATGATAFGATGGVDPLHHTFTMVIGAGCDDGINYSECGTCFPPSDPCLNGQLGWQSDASICESLYPQPYFTMYLDDNFSVIAGQRVPTGISQPFTYSGNFLGNPYD